MPTGMIYRNSPLQPPLYLFNPMNEAGLEGMPIVDELVARTFRLPKMTLHSTTRSRQQVAFARQIAMYLGHVCLCYSFIDLALYYRRDRTTIAHACRVIEERREEEKMELVLNGLESALLLMTQLAPEALLTNMPKQETQQ